MKRLGSACEFLWECRWPITLAVLLGLYWYALSESYKASVRYESLQVLP